MVDVEGFWVDDSADSKKMSSKWGANLPCQDESRFLGTSQECEVTAAMLVMIFRW